MTASGGGRRTVQPAWDPVWGPRTPPGRRRLRRLLKRLLASIAARDRSPADPSRGVAVLAYHGTGATRDDPWWLDFAGQMKLIEELGYEVVPLGQVVRLLGSGRPPARPTLAITFDDGYANNLEVAFPELTKRGWPATVFIVTSFAGRRPFLLAEEIARLPGLGVEVGNHTHSHPDLRSLDGPAIAAELDDCGRRLEQITGRRPRHFCYPYGHYSPAVRAAVAAAGLESACTGRAGFNPPGGDAYTLRRLTIERGEGARELRLRLAGGYDFQPLWRRRGGSSRGEG